MDIKILNNQNVPIKTVTGKQVLSLTTEEHINSMSKGSLTMTISESNKLYGFLNTGNRIVIRKDNKVLFGGQVYGIKATYQTTNTFLLQDMLGYLNNRIVYDDITYNNQTIEYILNDIFTRVNNIEPMNIGLKCDVKDTVESVEIEKGTSVFDILDELLANQYEYIIDTQVAGLEVTFTLLVTHKLGEDRTAGNNYLELKLDKNKTNSRSLDDITWDIDINYTCNVVLGKNNDWESVTKIDTASIEALGWRIEKSVNFNTDLEQQTAQYLKDRKNALKGLNIVPSDTDYFTVWLGDKVRIIAKGNKYLELDEGIRVIWKKFESWDKDNITFIFNTSKVTKSTGLELIVDEINKLKKQSKNL